MSARENPLRPGGDTRDEMIAQTVPVQDVKAFLKTPRGKWQRVSADGDQDRIEGYSAGMISRGLGIGGQVAADSLAAQDPFLSHDRG
jgi:hypothetical protein